jgi:hypothetical protein
MTFLQRLTQKVSRATGGVEDPTARGILTEVVQALDQLQDGQLGSKRTKSDGLTENNQFNELLDGAHLRFVSKGFADLVHVVNHGLGRTPQGCIFTRVRSPQYNECVIEGDEAFGGIKAADQTTVTFLIGDPAGSIVTAILF